MHRSSPSLRDQLPRDQADNKPLVARGDLPSQRGGGGGVIQIPRREPSPHDAAAASSPPRPSRRGSDAAISTTGRHFAVANVGDDGTIYLRYEDTAGGRNAHEHEFDDGRPMTRSPSTYTAYPPAFGLPPSPPLLPVDPSRAQPSVRWHDGLHESAAAAAAAATSVSVPHHTGVPGVHDTRVSVDSSAVQRTTDRAARPLSFATPPSQVPAQMPAQVPAPSQATRNAPPAQREQAQESALQPSAGRSPPVDSPVVLEVPIPSYRIGTPRVGDRGTIYLHDSFYSIESEQDNRVSNFSHLELDDVFPAPPGMRTPTAFLNYDPSRTLTAAANPPRATDAVNPAIYDAFVRDSENPKYIRYLACGRILAATPARLIAQVTHVKVLDYDLLSDFFLTYRSFLSPKDLLRYMLARMRWAVFSSGPGRVVRVRTFVALRHWILNYFVDDFEPDYDLRLLFCSLVNDLSKDLYARPDKGGGDLQVVGELKKCWRRVCDVIWGTDEGAHPFPATHDISPGGKDSQLLLANGLDQQDQARRQQAVQEDFFHQVERQKALGAFDPVDMAAMVTSPQAHWRLRSESLEVTSCSIPMWKRLGKAAPSFRPRALMPASDQERRNREVARLPSTTHRRHGGGKGSQGSDETVVDNRPDSAARSTTPDIRSFDSGDLIRGVLVPPPLPQVTRRVRVGKDGGLASQLDLPGDREGNKRLNVVGSVKRKLSSRSGTLTSRSDSSPGSWSSRQDPGSGRLNVPGKSILISRSDFLAARVAEAYENLIREDQEADQTTPTQARFDLDRSSNSSSRILHGRNGSIIDIDKDLPPPPTRRTDRLNSHMTSSSRSIMIINDIENEPVPAVPEFDLHDKIIPKDNRIWQKSPSRFANGWNGSDEGSQLSVQQLQGGPKPQTRGNKPLGSKASTLKIGSATERLQYSVSPSVSTRSDTPTRGLGLLMPDNDGRPSFEEYAKGADDDDDDEAQCEMLDIASDGTAVSRNQLRRRPGGDLRAADNIDELARPKNRRNSTGDIPESLMSRTTSATLSTETDDAQPGARGLRSRLGSQHTDYRQSDPGRRKSLQLLSTHSSKPVLRPSFQVEVDKLAKLPNDEGDDGGLESTLAKLEGRSPMSSPTYPPLEFGRPPAPPASPEEPLRAPATTPEEPLRAPATTPEPAPDPPPKPKRRSRVQVIGHPDHPETSRLILDEPLSPQTETMGASIYDPSRSSRGYTPEHRPRNPATFEDPYVVDGIRGGPIGGGNGARWSGMHGGRRSESSSRQNWPLTNGNADEHNRSSTRASSSDPNSSFLLNDDESLSEAEDDGSEGGNPRASTATNGDRSFFLEEDGETGARVRSPTNRAFDPPLSPPPSTPLPAIPFAAAAPLYDPIPEKAATRLRTPGPEDMERHEALNAASSSSSTFPFPDAGKTTNPKSRSDPELAPTQPPKLPSKPKPTLTIDAPPKVSKCLHTSHTPFVLAFPSVVLAAQLTIIERDALSEIDWQELVTLKWASVPPTIQNWAEYMRLPNQSGVDIVIARFNLAVRWVVSEILLTDDATDRARTISKFIHVAAHARRLRNFATMYQLTVALCSDKVVRLKRTWLLVPPGERDVLKTLETVIQPVRNFARLRAEMEAALTGPAYTPDTTDPAAPTVQRSHSTATGPGTRSNSRMGTVDETSAVAATAAAAAAAPAVKTDIHVKVGACVPFIGIYTHDLAFNAQKPAFVDPEPATVGVGVNGSQPSSSSSKKEKNNPGKGGGGGGDTELMVNFERFQTKAAIVKNLLRLLEASARYVVRPDRELVARCLWLAALDEGELERRSRGLEPGGAGAGGAGGAVGRR